MSTDTRRGGYCDVTLDGKLATKIAREGHTEEGPAREWAELLQRYVDALAGEPLPVARVHDVSVVQDDKGLYHVRHVMDQLTGRDIHDLDLSSARRKVLRQLIGHLGSMSQMDGKPGVLQVPVDGWKSTAYQFDKDGEARLVDVYPPLLRDKEGKIIVSEGLLADRIRDEQRWGSVPHMVASLALMAGAEVAWQEKLSPRDWALEALPPDGLDPATRELIEAAITDTSR